MKSLLKTVKLCGSMPGGARSGPTHGEVTEFINKNFDSPLRSRMLGLLLENQPLDTWMTHELMGAAIKWVENKKPLEIVWKLNNDVQTYNQGSSTTADLLKLENEAVDSFYNFQTIKGANGQLVA